MGDNRVVESLRAHLRGDVIAPQDGAYDEARAQFNATVERRPLAISHPADARDVATAVKIAADASIPISVRGGGHSIAGHSFGDGALAIDLRALRDVSVDPGKRLGHAGGGVMWEEFDAICVRHGLATTGGTFADTGIGGLALGGGLGHIQSPFGFSVDNLRSVEIVTADGVIRTASELEHQDLFWALRGGGGNFGVVTRFTFALHPVGTLLGGLIAYPFTEAEKATRLYRDVMASAPDELTCFLAYTALPDPDATKILGLSVCYVGAIDAGEEEIRPLRTGAAILGDTVAAVDYTVMQATFPKVPFGLRHYWKGFFLRDLPEGAIGACVEHMAGYRGGFGGGMLIEEIHGAPRNVPREAMAFDQRGARYNVSALSVWEDPAFDEQGFAWGREAGASLEPFSETRSGYVNYMSESASPERVAAIWGADKFERLRAIKRRYDPANLFRVNQNIPPA